MSRRFLLDLLERTARTFVQAFAASLVYTGLDDWRAAAGIAAGAGVLAVASSLAAKPLGNNDSASVIPEK